MDIPHNAVPLPYNCFDERCYQKEFTYFKKFAAPDLSGHKRAILRFDAYMAKATIYLNGVNIGEHYSLYFPVELDITELIKDKNLLVVRLDGREDKDVPPFGGAMDYLTFAGIYRPVHLYVKPKAHFEFVGVHGDHLGNVSVTETHTGTGKVLYEVHDENGILLSSENPTFHIDNPHPYSPDDPYRYRFKAYLKGEDEEEDVYECYLYLISTDWKSDGFYLNGEKLKLMGLNRHQSYPHIGYASTESLEREDARILKDTGINVVRTSHYMDSDYFLDECGKLGLLVVDEVPGWQHLSKERKWRENYFKQVEALARCGYNHGHIIAHGVRIDESMDDYELYSAGNKICRSIDPHKKTIGVRNFANSELLEDIYGYNDFCCDDLEKGLDKKKKITRKEHPYLVTEYLGHMFPTKQTDSYQKLFDHALRHQHVQRDNFNNDDTAGAIAWCFADYYTHSTFGSGDRICAHGVYDMYRLDKPAAYVYRSQNDRLPTFEPLTNMVTGEWDEARFNKLFVATNADYFEVYNNGHFVKRIDVVRQEKGLPYPMVEIKDLVSPESIDRDFSKEDKELMAKMLSKAAIDGFSHLGLWNNLRVLSLMMKYHLKYDDLVDLYNKAVASWGGDGKGKVYTFKAYKDGKLFREVSYGPSYSYEFKATCDRTDLENGLTYDIGTVVAGFYNEYGTLQRTASFPVSVEIEGPFELLSPSCVSLLGGRTRVYFRSLGKAGKGKITLTCQGQTKVIDISVR